MLLTYQLVSDRIVAFCLLQFLLQHSIYTQNRVHKIPTMRVISVSVTKPPYLLCNTKLTMYEKYITE